MFAQKNDMALPSPLLFRYYLGLAKNQNLYYGLMQAEYEHILSKEHYLSIQNYVMLKTLHTIIINEKHNQIEQDKPMKVKFPKTGKTKKKALKDNDKDETVI